MLADQSNKTKVMELFKQEGKGGIIEIEEEPIFPLKMTIDYLLLNYNQSVFNMDKVKAKDSQNKFTTPTRRAFKESKNFNNMSSNSSPCYSIEVEGKINQG